MDPAEQALQKAIELDVNYRPAYFMLANLYASTKKNEQALRKVNELVAKTGENIVIGRFIRYKIGE